MNLELYVWRQSDAHSPGGMVRYEAEDIAPDMSFLDMLDVVNLKQIENGEEPIAFDSDCREGICGARRHSWHRPETGGSRQGASRRARAATRRRRLPASHEEFQGWGNHPHRALAVQGVSGNQGSSGGSKRSG